MYDHSLAQDFAKSALSLVDTSSMSPRERAAAALAALASAGRDSLEQVVAHHQVGVYTHRNPDGSRAVVARGPWVVMESGIHFGGPTRLDKWKEIRSGARIGKGVVFGDWATVGEGAVIGDGVSLGEHSVVPDGHTVTRPDAVGGPAPAEASPPGIASRFLAATTRLLGAPVEPQRDPPREVRVQCALDLVDLVEELVRDDMSDDEIVETAYAAANSYFIGNTGFVVREADIDDYTIFSKSLLRHVNPDGTTAVVTSSAFGGLGEDVVVEGHAFVGDWAYVEGRSFLARGAATPSHMEGRDVIIETTVSPDLDVSDLQALLRVPFLVSTHLGHGIEIAPEEIEVPSDLHVVAPKVDDSEWAWGEDGPIRPRRPLPFGVGGTRVEDGEGNEVDVAPRRRSRFIEEDEWDPAPSV